MTAPAHRALVTGGARGIGAAIVAALRAQGVDVLAPGRDALDLARPDSVDAWLADHADAGVDILVNNAGINRIAVLGDVRPDDWAEMIQVNLTAPFRLAQGLAPGMIARGWGRVVNVSSVFSQVTREGRSPYSSTKSGLNGLTRTLAVELAPHGVLVNAVGPGYVETEMTHRNNTPEALEAIRATIPAGRLAQPAEIAELVAFLASERNTYLTGQLLVCDGGFSCR